MQKIIVEAVYVPEELRRRAQLFRPTPRWFAQGRDLREEPRFENAQKTKEETRVQNRKNRCMPHEQRVDKSDTSKISHEKFWKNLFGHDFWMPFGNSR